MWPLTFRHIPPCREAVIVCLADKYCAIVESMFRRTRVGADEEELYRSRRTVHMKESNRPEL